MTSATRPPSAMAPNDKRSQPRAATRKTFIVISLLAGRHAERAKEKDTHAAVLVQRWFRLRRGLRLGHNHRRRRGGRLRRGWSCRVGCRRPLLWCGRRRWRRLDADGTGDALQLLQQTLARLS